MYAVIKTGGKQYRVAANDVLTIEKLEGAAGDSVEFTEILMVGEGAGALVLESLEHAQARGAPILAEIVGYGTNSDGRHVTQPNQSKRLTDAFLAGRWV